MFSKLSLVVAILFLTLAFVVPDRSVTAQSPVPMLFTGTATVDGRAVPEGTTITVYTARGIRVASTTTGGSGQAANGWTLTAFDTSLEDQTLYFYVNMADGTTLPKPDQRQITAVYDAVGGRGRANVEINVQTPVATPTPAPTRVLSIPSPTPAPTSAVRLTLPSAPISFQAISDGGRNMTLAWRDAATNEDGYELWRWDALAGWMLAAVLRADATSHQDNGLKAGVTYYYYLGSYNTLGYSSFVEAIASVPAPQLQAPGSFRAQADATSARLSWLDINTGENGYELWRWNEREGWLFLGVLPADSISYADTGLNAGAAYWYYLASYAGTTYSDWASASVEIPGPTSATRS